MKFITSQLTLFLRQRGARRNIGYLLRFILVLVALVCVYSILFHYIMEYEGQSYSWLTGFYWTLTVMSTLGFGDITFTSDLGRLFSIVVLLSGVLFLLVMLPFAFIEYFYAPWLEAQKKDQVPRDVSANTKNHVILVGVNPMLLSLVDTFVRYGIQCVILCPDSQVTLDFFDQGYQAVMGEHDNGEVYKRLQVEKAAMVVALDSDVRNTNIVFTVREICATVPITARVENEDSLDILQLAGANDAFQFHKLLGEALAYRGVRGAAKWRVISRFEGLVVAEAPVIGTFLVGKTVTNCGLRDSTGVNVVGIWQRGVFTLPQADTLFTENSVLMVAGTEEQMAALDALIRQDIEESQEAEAPAVLILGGGRVGIAAAEFFDENDIPYTLVDKKVCKHKNAIQGDAADLAILEKAGIRTAPSVLVTTHDDDTNVYLTLYCRKLQPDIQIVCRASLDRNINMLYAAGADLVLSQATMVTGTVMNLLSPGQVFMLNEGLNMFRAYVRGRLVGKTLMDSDIRETTNCNLVGCRLPGGAMQPNPEPSHVFTDGEELYMIGDPASQAKFFKLFGDKRKN